MGIHWLRYYHGTPTDPKWIVVGRLADVVPGMVSATWGALLDHTSQATPRGNVAGFDVPTWSAFSGWSEQEIESVLSALRKRRIIDDADMLAAWSKRQPKREDDSKERVRRYRSVTHRNAKKRKVTRRNAVKRKVTTDKISSSVNLLSGTSSSVQVEETSISAIQHFYEVFNIGWNLVIPIEEWADRLYTDYRHLPRNQIGFEIRRCSEWWQGEGRTLKAPDRAIRNWLSKAKPIAGAIPQPDRREALEEAFKQVTRQDPEFRGGMPDPFRTGIEISTQDRDAWLELLSEKGYAA